MVRAVEVAIAETDETLRVKAGQYKISINKDNTTIKGYEGATGTEAEIKAGPVVDAIKTTIGDKWNETKVKSANWGTKGESASISATIKVEADGSFSVSYAPESLELMIGKKTAKTTP